jgi:hypothetical protein
MIPAAIVHENQLERLSGGFHDNPQTVVQLGYVFFFVMKRYDDGILRHDHPIINAMSSLRFCEVQENT